LDIMKPDIAEEFFFSHRDAELLIQKISSYLADYLQEPEKVKWVSIKIEPDVFKLGIGYHVRVERVFDSKRRLNEYYRTL